VVVDVQNGMPFWAPLFSRATVVNVTHHVHREQWRVIFGPVLGRVGWWLESRVAPRVYRRCRYLTVSTATREDLIGLGVDPRRITVIYSGVDPPSLPSGSGAWARSARPSLVVLGRLVPHKRVDLALAALAALRGQWPDLALTVIGHGYWEPALRDLAAELGVSDAVRFTGFVDEAAKHRLLAEAWVHLMPSVKEGWGLAVIESGAHATPTVAFATAGGTVESVRHRETGLLVDSDDAFVGAVRVLLADEELRARLGRGARAHASRFSWEATADDVEAELRAIAGLGPRPAPASLPVVPAPRRPDEVLPAG
jgi:glycosyltransferase involved in cell wall biosynthesis